MAYHNEFDRAEAAKESRRKAQRKYYQTKVKARREEAVITGPDKKMLVQIRLPNAVVGRLTRILNEGIATGSYPWRTRNAIIEALILKGLDTMAGDPVIDEMLQYLKLVQHSEGISQHRREAKVAFSHIKTETSELLGIGEEQAAIHFFSGMMEDIDRMDQSVWRDWLIRSLHKAFPKLVGRTLKTTPLHSGKRKAAAAVPVPAPVRRLGKRR